MMYHTPALLQESINGLNINPQGIYVDATFGGGGHSAKIMSKLNKNGKLIAFDQDADAEKNAFDDDRLIFIRHNFKYMIHFLDYHQIKKVNGILADLGVSFHQFDTPQRGFSFGFSDATLDMRMNQDIGKTANDILNQYSADQLARIFKHYGDVKMAGKIANAIEKGRAEQQVEHIEDLLSIIKPFIPKGREHKFLAKIFQALRIEVNDEMNSLKEFLLQAADVIAPGGRLVVIAYHSAEDRLVKRFMQTGNFEGNVKKDFYGNIISPFHLINKKVIMPDQEEIKTNPRSRSAKLRIAEKN
ncbi:MAG: 16S rRNA (cytosine(1402)-N(4))-methyltransferase RsmH [Bacteroidota bacterium]